MEFLCIMCVYEIKYYKDFCSYIVRVYNNDLFFCILLDWELFF